MGLKDSFCLIPRLVLNSIQYCIQLCANISEAVMTQSNPLPEQVDVLIVGAGNAAMCAALSARESGVSVAILERAPLNESGGNSRFTAGAIRCVYDGVEDLRRLMPDLTDTEISNSDFGTYSEDQFFDDMGPDNPVPLRS